jgi:hypothetical protein
MYHSLRRQAALGDYVVLSSNGQQHEADERPWGDLQWYNAFVELVRDTNKAITRVHALCCPVQSYHKRIVRVLQ